MYTERLSITSSKKVLTDDPKTSLLALHSKLRGHVGSDAAEGSLILPSHDPQDPQVTVLLVLPAGVLDLLAALHPLERDVTPVAHVTVKLGLRAFHGLCALGRNAEVEHVLAQAKTENWKIKKDRIFHCMIY